MEFDKILIGFAVFTLIVLGGVMMINDTNDSYEDVGVNMTDEDFGDVYNTMDELYDTDKSAKEKVLEGEVSETDSLESMTRGSYSAIRLISNSFSLFTNITNAISAKLGLPRFVTKIAFIIFSISIVFGIVYLIFRFRG